MEDIHGLKPFIKIAFPLLPFLFFMLVLIGLIILVWYLVQRFLKRPSKPAPIKPRISAKDAVLRELQQLGRSQLIEKGDAEGFYLQLSQIFRTYVTNQHHVSALAYTVAEMRHWVQQQNPTNDLQYDLNELLKRENLAKFALYSIADSAMKKDLQRSIDFIHFLHTT